MPRYLSEERHETLFTGESIKSKEVQIGMRVRVHEGYRKAHLRGLIGTIKKRYGGERYVALEVHFGDGRLDLFWPYDLEEA